MALRLTRRCVACSHEFEILEDRGASWAIDHPALGQGSAFNADQQEAAIEMGELLECPRCFCDELLPVLSVGVGIMLGGAAGVGREYPYFDRNLQVEITSATHHREVCRLRGLRQADGGAASWISEADSRLRENEKREAEFQEDQRRQRADPGIRRTVDVLARVRRDAGPDPLKQSEAVREFMQRGH